MSLTQFLRAKKLWPLRADIAPTAMQETGEQLAREFGEKPPPLMPDETAFFDMVRKVTGKLTQGQVDSVNEILKAGSHWPLAWMAYGLATAWHESRFMPIMEKGGAAYLSKYDTGKLAKALGNTPEADGDGIFYAGRGFVQLTGRRNYGLAGAELGLDLLNHPELALERAIAAKILVWGMAGGKFTGRKLSDYLATIGNHEAYVRARKIINGTDRAELIAGYAGAFEKALASGAWG